MKFLNPISKCIKCVLKNLFFCYYSLVLKISLLVFSKVLQNLKLGNYLKMAEIKNVVLKKKKKYLAFRL